MEGWFPRTRGEHTRQRIAKRTGHEGTGIGLALAQELVELHGGRIWAESAGVGSGSQFHVVLPRGEADVAAEDRVGKEATALEGWRAAFDAELGKGDKDDVKLLKNATEALEGRGGIIRITASRDQDKDGKRDDVVITVADDGPGIAPAIRERLFEPFVTTKATGRGAGRGLSVCRRILDELGGTIKLRSTDGALSGGATFEIRLPISTEGTQITEITRAE